MVSVPLPLALDVQALEKAYGPIRAVSGISFTQPKGVTLGLLGGNGAGKSTLIGIIMGLITPTRGRVFVLGQDMARHRNRVLRRINFASPFVDLPHRLTVRQNLTIFGRLYGVPNLDRRICCLAEEFNLGQLLARETGSLSAGQRTRVALAKALINEPELLLLDEPTASLDPETADWVRSRLEAYRSFHGASMLLASHNMGEVDRLCDQIIILNSGQIADRGTPRELAQRHGQSNLEDTFIKITRTGKGE